MVDSICSTKGQADEVRPASMNVPIKDNADLYNAFLASNTTSFRDACSPSFALSRMRLLPKKTDEAMIHF